MQTEKNKVETRRGPEDVKKKKEKWHSKTWFKQVPGTGDFTSL